jgi:hypothetical protein
MSGSAHPTRPAAWQGQWLRLRALRVERARAALRVAEQAEAVARMAVDERQRRITQGRADMEALAHDWSGASSAALPRWNGAVTAWRDALVDRLERDEYALIDEERMLEEALDALQARRAQLVRAMARQEAVGEFVRQSCLKAGREHERRAERELDDVWRLPGGPS